MIVWVSYPLKQGLKLPCDPEVAKLAAVWVSYPLKQGLKQETGSSEVYRHVGLSQLSIKTRIETKSQHRKQRAGELGLSQLSIKTRIETRNMGLDWSSQKKFESAIH